MGKNLKITLLAGGVGGAKMAEGFAALKNIDLSIIGNVGDDDEFHGLRVSPDIDTITYTLSGLVNRKQGWGLQNESLRALNMLERLGNKTWMTLGDTDFGLHIHRTQKLLQGSKASDIAQEVARKLGIKAKIILPTDDKIRTQIKVKEGWISFQEYFVKRRCKPKILKLRYSGIKKAKINLDAIKAINSADFIVIAPSNPLVSIKPIIDIPEFKKFIKNSKKKVIAVSPIISGKTVKGPASKMLRQLGYKSDAFEALRFYKNICGNFVIDRSDRNLKDQFENSGLSCHLTNILMRSIKDKKSLAQKLIKILSQ